MKKAGFNFHDSWNWRLFGMTSRARENGFVHSFPRSSFSATRQHCMYRVEK
jgi:hypothetical protein